MSAFGGLLSSLNAAGAKANSKGVAGDLVTLALQSLDALLLSHASSGSHATDSTSSVYREEGVEGVEGVQREGVLKKVGKLSLGAAPPPSETLPRHLSQMKVVLYGSSEEPLVDEAKAQELARASASLLKQLVGHLDKLPFEARKDVALIFNNVIRKPGGDFSEYVFENFNPIMTNLVHGYKNPDIALSCGSMLRECIRHENLARLLLNSELLWLFFDVYAHLPNFEVALDAINTLRDLLVSEKSSPVAAEFMQNHYIAFFKKYDVLLLSGNYVTRIRSLKLLGEMLLDRVNFNVMMRYIASRHNLKIIMNSLRDKSANIQIEAFHVFKIFVANPKKPPEIAFVLYQNKSKLIAYLEAFQVGKDDGQFSDERDLLVETLAALEEPPPFSYKSSSTNDEGSSSLMSAQTGEGLGGKPEYSSEETSLSSGDKTEGSADGGVAT